MRLLPVPALRLVGLVASTLVTLATLATFATREAHADEDLGAPFGALKLVDEVDTGNAADPHALYEDPPGASKIATVLGRSARVLPMTDDAQVVAYKIGAGKGLVAGKAYVLVVEYPEDEGRQFVIINRGGEMTRTYATGQTIGDSRESYTFPAPESMKYPLSGKWQSVRSLFYLGERFQGVKAARDADKASFADTPDTGFWVVIGHFRKKDSPLDAGAAVARIRLFEAPTDAALEQPIHFPPSDLPRRHVFWREEMADTSMGSSDPTHRFFSKSIDVFDAKMRLAKFLGVNTFSRHLLVFGYTQYWDNAHGGGNGWYFDTAQPELWGQMIDAAQKHGLDVMPYFEYAGAMGAGTAGAPSLGRQRRCRPLGDRKDLAYSDVWWSEAACVDVTDPDFETDVDKLLDATIGQYKGKASFVGAWFRTRSSNWPISFTDAALARFGKEAGGGITPTRSQLETDAALIAKYYAWWFGKRRDFLVHIRDHLRLTQPDAAVLFTAYIEEALHVPDPSDLATPNDDTPTWDKVNGTPPWQWRFAPTPWQPYVDAGKYGEMIVRMRPPSAETIAKGWPELDHSAPPADPARYVDVEGVHMAMPFSRLFTVSSPKQLDDFRAKSGLAIVRHFNLNEEDGQDPSAPSGPMSKRVGYFVTDVDRTGPYSMLAEARAVAFGDPRYVGYLSSSNFSRGFPEYTRAFNAAYLALPALASSMVSGAASDREIVVREIKTSTHGTYYAVVNTSMATKSGVSVKLPATGSVRDLVANVDLGPASSPLAWTMYPGELRALVVGGDAVATDGGPLPPGSDAGTPTTPPDSGAEGAHDDGLDGASAADAPSASSGCSCRIGGEQSEHPPTAPFGLGALGLVVAFAARARRRFLTIAWTTTLACVSCASGFGCAGTVDDAVATSDPVDALVGEALPTEDTRAPSPIDGGSDPELDAPLDTIDTLDALDTEDGAATRDAGTIASDSAASDAGSMKDSTTSSADSGVDSGALDAGPSSSRLTPFPLGSIGAPNGYYEYLPPGYSKTGIGSPLMVFWHGLGEDGNGTTELSRVLTNGPPRYIKADAWPAARPFIVLSPQNAKDCPTGASIKAFITWAMAHYNVDPARLYLTGLSCGAIGSWSYLATEVSTTPIAAAVLIAGTGNSAWDDNKCGLGRIALWAFHGDADTTVMPSGTTYPMTNLIACPSPPRRDAQMTIYPGVGHDSWSRTYDLSAGHDVYAWMLANHL